MSGAKSAAATFRLLWETKQSVRSSLSVGGIVEAAIALADAEGLGAVSMQRVAGELGYTAMALYRHVPGKDQLVALMSDKAQGNPPAASGEEWRAEILNWADAAWDFYLAHPWMLRVATTGAPTGPNELAWFEALLRPLAQSGLATENLVGTAMFIPSAVRDLARIATEIVPSGSEYGDLLAQVIRPDQFPTLSSLMASGVVEDDGDVRPALDFGLDLILDGLKSHTSRPVGSRPATRRPPSKPAAAVFGRCESRTSAADGPSGPPCTASRCSACVNPTRGSAWTNLPKTSPPAPCRRCSVSEQAARRGPQASLGVRGGSVPLPRTLSMWAASEARRLSGVIFWSSIRCVTRSARMAASRAWAVKSASWMPGT